MAKVVKKIKLQVPGGKATPAPPVGTALGPAGVNIGQFVQQFNAATQDQMGDILPVEISVMDDRSFTFIVKVSPASRLLLKWAGLEKGSGKVPTVKAGSITKAQLKEIAEKKIPDLNTKDTEQAMKIIAGTARSMGIDVK
ncbi:MAG: 50S ribosomal protein L11 [Patescibacteria group bacterium]